MNRSLAVLAAVLLWTVFSFAQSSGGNHGGGTTINATNTKIPVRSNATTFIDSSITDSGSLVTIANPVQFSGSAQIDVPEVAAPASPAASTCRLYIDSTTHQFAGKNSGGTSCLPSSGSYPALTTTETGLPAAPSASNVASALMAASINGNTNDALVLRNNNGRATQVGGGGAQGLSTDGTTVAWFIDQTGAAKFNGTVNLSVLSQDSTVGGGDLFVRSTGASNNATFGATGTGAVSLVGHTEMVISGATVPTVHTGTCGTSPSLTAGSTDNSFEIVVGTGGAATSCQVDFGKAFAKTSITHPNCTANSQGDFLVLKPSYATGASVTFTATSALTAGSKISGLCF